MNLCLKKFIEEKFKKQGKALDLGAGNFSDVNYLKQLGWKCEGVDKNVGVDLVYSNYVFHKLVDREQFVKTAYDNLKVGGWFFLHTFDKSDSNSNSDITSNSLKEMLKRQGFRNIRIRAFDYYDKEKGHNHWHKILEATSQK